MVISSDKNSKANVIVDNVELEQVKEFKYLGQTITADAKTETEIRIRTCIAKGRYQELNKILSNKKISQKLKLRLINCFIMSVFTYGSETWTINKDIENKINAFEMWILRRVANVKCTVGQRAFSADIRL